MLLLVCWYRWSFGMVPSRSSPVFFSNCLWGLAICDKISHLLSLRLAWYLLVMFINVLYYDLDVLVSFSLRGISFACSSNMFYKEFIKIYCSSDGQEAIIIETIYAGFKNIFVVIEIALNLPHSLLTPILQVQ